MSRIDIVKARLRIEEGKRTHAYNDATGAVVTCRPTGNLTIGFGADLENGLDDVEIEFLLDHRVGLADTAIAGYWWMQKIDDVRGSVLTDMVYNEGLGHLLEFVKMLAAIGNEDWSTARAELLNSRAADEDPDRYKKLADILYLGVDSTLRP